MQGRTSYKRNEDKRLRRDNRNMRPEDRVYIHVKRKNEKETRHELAPTAEGPVFVQDVNADDKNLQSHDPIGRLRNYRTHT